MTPTTPPRLLLLLACLAAPAVALGGQAVPVPWNTLSPGQQLRLELRDGQRIIGRLQPPMGDPITLTGIRYTGSQPAQQYTRTIPGDSFASMWLASGTHWRKGGVIGALAGGRLGLAAGLTFPGQASPGGCDGGCVAGAAVRGTLVGAVIGGTVGLFVPRWTLVF